MKHPIVCIFGTLQNPTFQNGDVLTISNYLSDSDSENVIATKQPDVIISVGEDWHKFEKLASAKHSSHHKWIHLRTIEQLTLEKIFFCYMTNLSKNRLSYPSENMPLISCFSPSYNSTGKINRPFRSLQAQSYPYWEWIIINDQPHCPQNCQTLKELEESDARIRVYSINKNTANIGQHKFETASLARGKYLVELDHDDDLTPDCLELIKKAFDQYPDAGFVYTDFCELFEKDLAPFKYGPVWALGFGGYYAQITKIPGVENPVLTYVARSANINEYTISNIVGVPNHIRVWEKKLYLEIGGHNPLPVGDDYELLIRTFLKTRFVRIPYLGYYQYRNESGNTTFKRINLITLIQSTAYKVYFNRINDRLIELGCKQLNFKNGIPVWEQEDNYVECAVNHTYKKEGGHTLVIITSGNELVFNDILNNSLNDKKFTEICVVGDCVDYLDKIINQHKDDLRLRWWNLHKSFNDLGTKCKKYADIHMVRTEKVEYIYC